MRKSSNPEWVVMWAHALAMSGLPFLLTIPNHSIIMDQQPKGSSQFLLGLLGLDTDQHEGRCERSMLNQLHLGFHLTTNVSSQDFKKIKDWFQDTRVKYLLRFLTLGFGFVLNARLTSFGALLECDVSHETAKWLEGFASLRIDVSA